MQTENSSFAVSFFGVGAPRCGTTWLYRCLRENPAVCMPNPKEVHFFSDFMAFTTTHSRMGWDWYRSKFAHCRPSATLGEFSPSYLYDEHAPERIHKAFPNAKILIQLRHPVEAAFSYFMHGKCTFALEDSFPEFLEKHPYFIDIFKYDVQLQRYFKLFAREQILCINYDDINREPETVLQTVSHHLGVDYVQPSILHKRINSYGTCKHKWLRNMLARTKDLLDSCSWTERLYKKLRLDHIGLRIVLWNRNMQPQKETIDPQTRSRLIDYYRESNAFVQQHTGIQTDDWNV